MAPEPEASMSQVEGEKREEEGVSDENKWQVTVLIFSCYYFLLGNPFITMLCYYCYFSIP